MCGILYAQASIWDATSVWHSSCTGIPQFPDPQWGIINAGLKLEAGLLRHNVLHVCKICALPLSVFPLALYDISGIGY